MEELSEKLVVFLSALLATFVGSVMGQDQNDRLKNGVFGGVAGSSIGGIAGLLGNDATLLLFGFFGSAAGGSIGWLAYLILSYIASTPWGRRLLVYQVGGLKAVLDQIEGDDQALLTGALEQWRHSFNKLLELQKTELDRHLQPGPSTDHTIRILVEGWLATAVETFDLLLEAVAKKPEYNFRVTLVVFGSRDGEVAGRHWISYAGRQPPHRTRLFDDSTIAFKVLVEALATPHLESTKNLAKAGAQERAAGAYHAFYAFRVNHDVVLSLDWPSDLPADDPFLQIARDFFHIDLIPSIADLLNKLSESLAATAGLDTVADWTGFVVRLPEEV